MRGGIGAGDGDARAHHFALRTLQDWKKAAPLRAHMLASEMLEASNLRDRAMGENLIWLANEHFRGRKIIVWAAARHLCHDFALAAPPEAPDFYSGMIAMGDVVQAELGKAAYTVMFTTYAGEQAMAGNVATAIEPAPEGSFEQLCHRIGSPFLFVDLRGSDPELAAFPRARMSARPFGYMSCNAPWSEIGDAFFFIDAMQPSTALGAKR